MMNRNEQRFWRDFGNALYEARVQVGLRQEDLAKKVGLSRTSIVNIEAGRQAVNLYTMSKIAKATGMCWSFQ
jgi:DNA-binding XRE family transcriptional regulator